MSQIDIKIPYPSPYPDNDLLIKEIINGTYSQALSGLLLSGQPISNRYVNFTNTNNFVKNITQNPTSIATYVNDGGDTSTMNRIKQMVYLPVTIKPNKKKHEYIYYPPYYYKYFLLTPDDGTKIATLPDIASTLSGVDLYYYWDGFKAKVFVYKDSNGNTQNVYLVDHTGNIKEIASSLNLGNIVGTYSFSGAICLVDKTDDGYTAYIINVKDTKVYKISIENADNIVVFGDIPLIAFHNMIYDKDGNKWEVINQDGIKDFIPINSDYYGQLSQSSFGDGVLIDNVYYIQRTDTTSYSFIFDVKNKKVKVKISNNNLGVMTSKIKFGYMPNYLINYNDDLPFSIYHYNWKKYKSFWITKMPLKYSEMKKDKGRWFAISEYGDFLYDAINQDIYYTYDFGYYFKLPSDTSDKINLDGVRMWLPNRKDKIIGFYGDLDIISQKVDDKTEYLLVVKGIVFYT